MEQLKNSNRNDLEMIQEKVQMAMAKKKEIIDALHAETQMKDVQVMKLKEMLERQRRELLLGKWNLPKMANIKSNKSEMMYKIKYWILLKKFCIS